MNKFLLSAMLGLAVLILDPQKSVAQINVSLNIGSQPLWGPVGYNYVEYYYLPAIETYYHVPSRKYVYNINGRWVYVNVLPSRYRGYDLYSSYAVVINKPRPYLNHNSYKAKYVKYKNYKSPKNRIIRYSNDSRYYVIKGHPGNGNKSNSYKGKSPSNNKNGQYNRGKSNSSNKNKNYNNKGNDNRNKSGSNGPRRDERGRSN